MVIFINTFRTLDMEAQLLELDQKIREALSVTNPRKEDAKNYLERMSKLVISGLMLKKNPHVVDAIKKVSFLFSLLQIFFLLLYDMLILFLYMYTYITYILELWRLMENYCVFCYSVGDTNMMMKSGSKQI